ncbi:MAG: hypothetical protein K2X47_10795 [Bdellovibrionales bacterium]|nr:hypothetical protein [Bdellovibrionales bacterium]
MSSVITSRRLTKLLLTLFGVYHLIVIVVIPNRSNYFNIPLGPYILPYANTMSLNVSWQFFAPEPGPAVFWEAEVKQDLVTIAKEMLPEEENKFLLRTRYNRRVSMMRFLYNDFSRVSALYVPYLCRMYPEATDVKVTLSQVPFPTADEVKAGKRVNDVLYRKTLNTMEESCAPGELTE